MRNLRKYLAVMLTVAMIFSAAVVPVMASEDNTQSDVASSQFKYSTQAKQLYDLGIFAGVSEDKYDPDLAGELTRVQGFVMLLRLFGLEDEAKATKNADTILKKFKDSKDIPSWAKPQVAYVVENLKTSGVQDPVTGDFYFKPNDPLVGQAFCMLILKQLGYEGDVEYAEAVEALAEKGGLTEEQVEEFKGQELNRDALVGISYGALKAEYKEESQDDKKVTVVEKLIELKKLNSTDVEEIIPEVLPAPVVTPTPTPVVEAVYPVDITAVEAIANTKVEVVFDRAISTAQSVYSNFAITYTGNLPLGVTGSSLSADGKRLMLTTAAQTEGVTYTLATSNIRLTNAADAAIQFVGKKLDLAGPTEITAAAYDNTTLLVTFVDDSRLDNASAETIANYSITPALTISKAEVIMTDDDIRGGTQYKTVALTTSSQATGGVYTISVTGVKDVAGNAPKEVRSSTGALTTGTSAITATVAGKVADVTAPVSILAKSYDNTTVLVKFKNTTDSTLNTAAYGERLDQASAQDVSNYTIPGLTINSAEVLLAKPADDARQDASYTRYHTVALKTTAQNSSTVYTVTVKGVKDAYGNAIPATAPLSVVFSGKAADVKGPEAIIAKAYNNTTALVKFTDDSDIDAASAAVTTNYSIPGLTISAAALITDPNDTRLDATYVKNKTVALTTSSQASGAVYEITAIQGGVKDVKGNRAGYDSTTGQEVAMPNYATNGKTSFAGKTADTTAPKLDSAAASYDDNAKEYSILLTFNEAMDKTSVENKFNYSVTGLGTPTSATQLTTTTVKLVTASQSVGTSYTITASNVKDVSGNIIDAAYKTAAFGGVAGQDTTPPTLETVCAINKDTIIATFSEPIYQAGAKLNKWDAVDVTNFSVKVGETTYALVDGQDVAWVSSDDSKTVTIQLKLAATGAMSAYNSGNGLLEGTIYRLIVDATVTTAQITDAAANKATNASTNYKEFGGSTTTDYAPYIESVTPVNTHQIKVIFSEAINRTTANIAAAMRADIGFSTSSSGTYYSLGSADTATIDLNDRRTVTVTLNNAGTTNSLKANSGFTTGFGETVFYAKVLDAVANIKDFAGVNLATTSTTYNPKQFAGSSTAPALAKLSSVTPIDNCTLQLNFDTPMNGTATAAVGVKIGEQGDTLALATANATLTWIPNTDGSYTSAKLYLNGTAAAGSMATAKFVDGTIYTVTLVGTAGAGEFGDVYGRAMDSTSTSLTKDFGVNSTAHKGPEIAAVQVIDGNRVAVRFSEKVTSGTTEANIKGRFSIYKTSDTSSTIAINDILGGTDDDIAKLLTYANNLLGYNSSNPYNNTALVFQVADLSPSVNYTLKFTGDDNKYLKDAQGYHEVGYTGAAMGNTTGTFTGVAPVLAASDAALDLSGTGLYVNKATMDALGKSRLSDAVKVVVGSAPLTLTGATYKCVGSTATSDNDFSAYQVYYSADTTLDYASDTLVGAITVADADYTGLGASVSMTGGSKALTANSTGYIYVVGTAKAAADVADADTIKFDLIANGITATSSNGAVITSNNTAAIAQAAAITCDKTPPTISSLNVTGADTATIVTSEAVSHSALAITTDFTGTVAGGTPITAATSAAVAVGSEAATILLTGITPVSGAGTATVIDINTTGMAKIFDRAGNPVAADPAAQTDANGTT